MARLTPSSGRSAPSAARRLRLLRRALSGRDGMTVLEVLISLAIFLVGSVSIIGLFATASVLHADAVNRRTASFIADELLAEVRTMRFRDVFARTTLETDLGETDEEIIAYAVEADTDSQAANFDEYPLMFDEDGLPERRLSGPILIEREWIWYEDWEALVGSDLFTSCQRNEWGTLPAAHTTPEPSDEWERWILQPRTWYYVLDVSVLPLDPTDDSSGWAVVFGDPTSSAPGAPPDGYIVIDGEWIRYSDINWQDVAANRGTFRWERTNEDRGLGGTGSGHNPGAPVTVAREHPYYPGFYYTVQFYPVSATGLEAQVIVSVAYHTGNLFRSWTFRTLFTPTTF